MTTVTTFTGIGGAHARTAAQRDEEIDMMARLRPWPIATMLPLKRWGGAARGLECALLSFRSGTTYLIAETPHARIVGPLRDDFAKLFDAGWRVD